MNSLLRHSFSLVVFLFLSLSCAVSYAQPDNRFEHLTTRNGLSHSTVFSLLQDKNGFMWFGTQDGGLNMYDGYRFYIFSHDPNDSTTIATNNVSTILEDRKGNIWIGTWGGGLDMYNPQKNVFIHYKNNPADSNSLSHNNAQAIFEDSKSNIWIGTAGGGLNKLDPRTGKFTHFRNIESDTTSISHNRIWSIAEDIFGVIWVGTSNGLNALDPVTGKFKRYYAKENQPGTISHPKVRTVFVDYKGILWVGTSNGLDRLDGATGKFVHYKPNPDYKLLPETNEVNVIYQDSKGNLWIGTHAGGLTMMDKDGRFYNYRSSLDNAHSLSYNDVRDIYEDRSGILWVATRGGGINKIDLKPLKFQHYRASDLEGQNNLKSNRIKFIYPDTDEKVWIGTDGGGLSLFDKNTRSFTSWTHAAENPNSISSNRVRAVYKSRNGTLWVGTDGSGINKIEPNGKITRMKNIPDNPNSVGDDDILSLAEDADGMIWVGTDAGLDRYDPVKNEFIHYRNNPDDTTSLSNDRIWYLMTDSQGRLWIGTDDGLNLYDHKTQKFTQYKNDPNKKNSISNNDIFCLHEDEKHNLWIGTGRGLNMMDSKTGKITYYSDKDGLPGNSIYSIQQSENGILWISTINGVSRFDVKEKKFRNYFEHDGLQSNEFNQGCGAVTKDGYFLFGGNNGFNVFHPDQVIDNPYIPQVVLTDFLLFNQPVKIGNGSPLSASITFTKSITLSYDQSVFTIAFAALSYNVPEENQYAYMLEGFDKDWVYSGFRRDATYTNLSPGKYIFRVKASNNDGVWNEKGTSLEIIITPPFWKTGWFYALCVIAGISLIYLLIKLRERKLIHEKKVLEEKIMRRTEKIKQQNAVLNLQKEELATRNQDIMDSIRYAKRIQEAILPPTHFVEEKLQDHFILYRPKDVVSGDFYWVDEAGGKILVAAVDCTGHGVPGAFVSIIGSNGLNRAVNEFGLTRPCHILDKLNELVIESLHQSEYDTKDGMDISICTINKNLKEIEYSGANNSLYYISRTEKMDAEKYNILRNGEHVLYEIKPDKQPIGGIGYTKKPFSSSNIPYEPGDVFYLFSDGYADQFGGEKGKKFKYLQLKELLLSIQHLSMKEQKEKLHEQFLKWKGNLEQVDDVCIIGIRL
jgi:ligand-binding sensor domain-containing protein/serine phosphatase RsbU (regulator of sigma subunit)